MLPALILVLAGPPDLGVLKGKVRPVVVFGSGALAERQRRELRGPGLAERDVAVLRGTPALARRLRVSPSGFLLVLVGKDGGVKLTSRSVVSRERLFALIDAMPMRRDEMRRRG